MKNSSNEIYLNGQYYSQNPGLGADDALWKATHITRLLKRNQIRPISVTEVGCGSGMILHHLMELNSSITEGHGFDISPWAITKARSIDNPALQFREGSLPTGKLFSDLVLMQDVIEHVDDYYSFLRSLRDYGRHFVFHIPLDLSCRMLLKPHILKQARDTVGHIHYFSREMVLWALEDTGYTIIDWFYTKPLADTSPSPTIFRWFKKQLRKLSFALRPNLSADLWGGYSMMILLEKRNAS
ncbi:MAG TPA: class I SAM-dependent methyltransferase [Flavitalea sp.]|nr:class I SAM-dependent methyltransferase [Flavitalea sp.]